MAPSPPPGRLPVLSLVSPEGWPRGSRDLSSTPTLPRLCLCHTRGCSVCPSPSKGCLSVCRMRDRGGAAAVPTLLQLRGSRRVSTDMHASCAECQGGKGSVG